MNRESSATLPTTVQPFSSAQRFAHAQPSEAEQPGTLAFPAVADTGARVVAQLDGLTASLEQATAGQRSFSPSAQNTAADEECLESYLQRYMQQLTGKKPESTATEALTADKQPVETAPEPPPPSRQPVAAPEDRLQLTAMRELANNSARQAMAESSQIQLIVKTRTTYLATKAVTLASSTLAVAYLPTHSTAALAGATLLFGIAVILGCRFAGLCRKLRGLADMAP